MKVEKFQQNDRHFMTKVTHVLNDKGKHYTVGDDRFSNFKQAAVLAGGNRTHLDEALCNMRKHVVAFFDMFFKYDGTKIPEQKFIEHGGDIINYIRLINGMLTEGDEHDKPTGCNRPDCSCHIPGDLCVGER
jgi:hypothetical protein